MWDRFGEFDSADEINHLAVNLRKEGDGESLKVLALENGLDVDIVEAFMGTSSMCAIPCQQQSGRLKSKLRSLSRLKS